MSVAIPTFGEKNLDNLIKPIRELATGRSNAIGNFSLATAGTTTTVTAANAGLASFIGLMPLNAAAQASGAFVSSQAVGSFIVTHSVSASSRLFRYAIQG